MQFCDGLVIQADLLQNALVAVGFVEVFPRPNGGFLHVQRERPQEPGEHRSTFLDSFREQPKRACLIAG